MDVLAEFNSVPGGSGGAAESIRTSYLRAFDPNHLREINTSNASLSLREEEVVFNLL
jgi:hypothetical protein